MFMVNTTEQGCGFKGMPDCCRSITRDLHFAAPREIVAIAMAARLPIRFPYFCWDAHSRVRTCTSFQNNHRTRQPSPDFSASPPRISGSTYHCGFTSDAGRVKKRNFPNLWCNSTLRLLQLDGQVHLCPPNETIHFSTLHRCYQGFAELFQSSIRHRRAVAMSGSIRLSTVAPGNTVSPDDVLQYW